MSERLCPDCGLVMQATDRSGEFSCNHEDRLVRRLTDDEAKAIRSLERLAKTWPRSLMLASMAGSLFVFYTDDHNFDDEGDGHIGVDEDKKLASIAGIPSTGGDW